MEALETTLLRVAVSPPPNLLKLLEEDNHGLVRVINRILPVLQDQARPHSGDLVLFIDQFEEIFTCVPDEATRLHFLDSLQEAITDQDCRLWVIIAGRECPGCRETA